jgi:hypothetical protein
MPDPSAFGLTDEELAEVEAARITLPSGAQRSAVQLAASWAANIEKIDSDRARPADDRSVWTEHDLAGALFVRDSLERALRQLPDAVRDKVERAVRQTDDRFRGFTVDDPGHRMAKVAMVDRAGRGWWWYRVPADGPIVADLARWPATD